MDLSKGYKKEKLTIDLVKANVLGIVSILPIALILGLPYYLLWSEQFTFNGFREYLVGMEPGILGNGALIVFVAMIGGIAVHELIHGITWALYAKKGFKSIKFGILWKMLTPYCHCKEPLRVKNYIIGAIMPGIIVGIAPAIIAMITGNLALLIFGIFFTMAASGDVMIINLLKNENRNDFVLDHPSEAGCYIFRKIEDQRAERVIVVPHELTSREWERN